MVKTEKNYTYSSLSIVQLCNCIVEESDEIALNEILKNRTILKTPQKSRVNFFEYLQYWERRLSHDNEEIALKTTDYLLNRFINIPDMDCGENNVNNRKIKKGNKGPDCRKQYKAFVKKFPGLETQNINDFTFEQIQKQEEEFKRLVFRHLVWCYKEAKRGINGWNRYNWVIKEKTITVYFPLRLEGKKRKQWLETNIGDIDVNKPDEKKRIQISIDQLLGYNGDEIHIEDISQDLAADLYTDPMSNDEFVYGVTNCRLRNEIADEKVKNFDILRPCIKEIGPEKVRRLIIRVFDDIEDDAFRPTLLAKEFKIEPSCMTNFAGNRWKSKDTKSSMSIPDLYKNIAKYLSSNQNFVEAAQQASVWDIIKEIIKE